MSKKPKQPDNTIVVNKKAKHDYFIEKTYESGVALQGWEVKSLRLKKVQIKESYIKITNGELYLFGCHISALNTASTHINPEALRTRKLLLHDYEIIKLISRVDRKGYTLVPLSLYWIRGKVKLSIGLAKGKKQHDKRASAKEKDWKITQARTMKNF